MERSVSFKALDGHELGGTLFLPTSEFNGFAVLICGGGNISSRKYSAFAKFLAHQGYVVLTFDYRGIGLSRADRLKGFLAYTEDWSEFDCGGAITFLRNEQPCSELIGVGHSVGSLLLCGAPNVASISKFIFIGAHTGFYKDYRRGPRMLMFLVWHVIMPKLTRLFGYFPANRLRLGEDIPAGVALQWAARRTPDLRPDHASPTFKRATAMLKRFSVTSGKGLVISFTDDSFATAVGTARFISMFPKLKCSFVMFSPGDALAKSIGHFGFFRRRIGEILWPRTGSLMQSLISAPKLA